LSTFGRRGSRESGWNWSRPPAGPGRPPPTLPLLPLAGAALLFVAIATALLAVWLSDGDESLPQDATATPVASATATRTPTPAPTPTAAASPTPVVGARLYLAAWDGTRWRADPPFGQAIFREGDAVPFLLLIDRVRPGDLISLSVTYGCQGFTSLTSYDRNYGSAPAMAEEGPRDLVPDAAVLVPDSPAGESAQLSLWGGLFARRAEAEPAGGCVVRKEVSLELSAVSDTLYLMWGAEIAPGAAARGAPLGLSVRVPALGGPFEIPFEIGPESVTPPRP